MPTVRLYEIRHRETGDLFALKTMHAADSVDPNKTARALAAAKGNFRIEHSNVVRVLDLNCEANGLVWMRTELLRGYTLQELLARQGRLSLPFALAMAIEAAAGIAAIHDAQIIHRDVKPSNLFYTESREVKVLDLSLAKVFPEGIETTVGGKRLGLGTPAYSAPEQLEGLVRPDVRFDIYGLGLTLWEMLTGTSPFADVLDNVPEIIKRQIKVMPPLLSEVARLPPQVDDVVRRAIAKDPMRRYSSAMEMVRALADLSAWVATEARAGRLRLKTPHGEPELPGDPNVRREYRPLEPTPEHSAPPSGPRNRVILGDPTPPTRPARAPQKLATTVPMNPPGGLAATLPLDDASAGAAATRTPSALLPSPTPAASSTPSQPTLASRPAGASPPRETPTGVTSSRSDSPRPGARAPVAAVLAALIAASLASVALVAWLLGRRPAPVDPAPAQIPSAPRSAEPSAPRPMASLKVEPPPAPEPEATSSATAAESMPATPGARPSAPPPPPVRRAPAPLPSTPLPRAPYPPPAPAQRAPFGLDQ